MMNLTGDGNGFDMVTLPQAMRGKVPTSNFFTQSGYEHNPVARKNNTVAALLAGDRRGDGPRIAIAGREGSGGGVLDKC